MIFLANSSPFARGGKRDCFVHPEFPDRCVKVHRLDALPENLHKNASWSRRMRKSVEAFDENISDFNVLSMFSGGALFNKHVPLLYGWEMTDRGRGLVMELFRDSNGLISRSLREYIWEHGYDDIARAAVKAFHYTQLIAHEPPLRT
jgi:hypothetical protein